MSRSGLRVLVLATRWPPSAFLRRLFERLAAGGAELTVASPDPVRPPQRWLPVASGAGIPHAVLARHSVDAAVDAARRGGWLASWRTVRPLIGRTESFRPFERVPFARGGWDLTYVPWVLTAVDYLPILDLLPPIVASCRGSQVTVAPWNPDRADQLDGLAEVFGRATLVHCVSEAIIEEAVALGMDRSKARVVRPGADTSRFTPPPGLPTGARAGRVAGRLRIVSVGNLEWVKGYEYLVTAVARLVEAGIDTDLTLIGEGRDDTRLRGTARDLGVTDRLHLLGACAPDEVCRRLQEADVFVLSSVSEGISNAVLEAMATALPVVTTSCGGMGEVVDDGVEGFVVPVRDVRAMVEALRALAAAPARAERMGRAALERVREGLTADANAAGVAAVLAEAVSLAGAAAA